VWLSQYACVFTACMASDKAFTYFIAYLWACVSYVKKKTNLQPSLAFPHHKKLT